MDITCASLFYEYPEHLVAQKPRENFRTLLNLPSGPKEISKNEIFDLFQAGDVLVVNDTKVLKRRIYSEDGLEILFIKQVNPLEWEVLFPAKRRNADIIQLPQNVTMSLLELGLPQKVQLSQELSESYFQEHGELALPPYIQKSRGVRKNFESDKEWYQTAWAQNEGSLASPTASLHFNLEDFEKFKQKGVEVLRVTLHVGLGTFLPIKTERLEDHKMHKEFCQVPVEVKEQIDLAKANNKNIWALGTTVTRTLESLYSGMLQSNNSKKFYFGETDLFIRPGYEFKVVDRLMTNFHQPGSTLLALVATFAGYQQTMESYKWAVKNEFKLFSYGDFSIWERSS